MVEKIIEVKDTDRLEFFSDGVFAIAITLLIIEIKVPTGAELQVGLLGALINKWPNYLAFFIGFFTTLVCWVNHQFIFNYVNKTNPVFNIVNSLILFLVAFVQYPTAVLAEFIVEHDATIAVQFYGITYILMALVYRFVWGYACKFRLTDEKSDAKTINGVRRMYNLAIVNTVLAFIISFWNLPISLILYIILFSLFMVPSNYTKLVMRFST